MTTLDNRSRARSGFLPAQLCLAGMLALTGCAPGVGKLIPVEGKVEADGIPLSAGQVRFYPETEKGGVRVECMGSITSDGTYTMTTNGRRGVPVGRYKVTVLPPPPPSGDPSSPGPPPPAVKLFDSKYELVGDTPLTVEVAVGASPGSYDLQLSRSP